MKYNISILTALVSALVMCGCSRSSRDSDLAGTNTVCCGSSHQLAVPKTEDSNIDWGAIRVSLSDSEIVHFHNRAKELINDKALWKRLGQKYEGPFEIKSDDFGYEFERLVQHKATVAVIVPIKKTDFMHPWFVKIVFRQYCKDNPEAEVESIYSDFWR